jgi:hypothetical protein
VTSHAAKLMTEKAMTIRSNPAMKDLSWRTHVARKMPSLAHRQAGAAGHRCPMPAWRAHPSANSR